MITCPNCGEENPARARFCLNCGQPFAQQSRSNEERKLVTVMFADLAGFTALSDKADPEDVKATLRPYHARLKREIEHYGGTIDKFLGDGVLAVFGAPAVHEDDPERAVRCALRVQDAIGELNGSMPGLDLGVRIGITTGEAVVSLGTGPQIGESLTGDVVNTASRLQSVAPVGGIVVGAPTYDACRDVFDWESLPAVRVKGKEEPLDIWRPVGVRSALGVGVEHRDRANTPFVGRDDDLARLKAIFHRAMSGDSVELVTVIGEPGVGKSRLIGELFAYIDDLPEIYQWRQGRCLPYGEGVTFWPLGEVVKAQAGILDSDPAAVTMHKLEVAVNAVTDDPGERDWLTARLATVAGRAVGMEDGAPRGTEPQAAAFDRVESFAAWRRFLEAVAHDRPMVLVFEDLHWAQPAMLDFIDELASSRPRVPMLVLCAGRPELFEARPRWADGRANATLVSLDPLSEQDTAVLISALLDRAVLPVETQSLLLERAGGNPLYAEEFVRMLRDHDLLEEHGRVLTLRSDVEVPLPQSVQALIAARLDSLPGDSKELLHVAAVLGKVFWAGALASMQEIEEAVVRERLDSIARKELIRESRRSTLEGESEYTFWHLLVRDVAYGQIPRAERAAKHRAAASWIERVSRERAADQSELLAYHYEQALELARATHQDREARGVEAHLLRFLITAGDKAMRLDASKAEGYYRRALEVVPGTVDGAPPTLLRSRLLVRAGRAAALAGSLAEANEDYERAIEGFRAAGDVEGIAGTLASLARSVHKLGDTASARGQLDEAIQLLESLPPGRELARVYAHTAGQYLVSGDNERCRELADKAIELAGRLGMDDEVVRALQFRGAARVEIGEEGGLEDLWQAIETGQRLGLGEEVGIAYGNLAYQLWLKDGPLVSLPTWQASKEFCEVRGYQTQAMWSRAGMLECLFDLGRWDELKALADEMVVWDREHGGSQVGVFACIYRARVLVEQSDADGAAALYRAFLPDVRRMQHAEFLAPALVVSAQVEHALGNARLALDLVREYADVTAATLGFRAHYLPEALRVAIGVGGMKVARALPPDPSTVRSARHRICLLTGEAILAEAGDEPRDAADRYAGAADAWRSYGNVLEHARALAGRARCVRAVGDEDAARALVEEASALLVGVPGQRILVDDDAAGAEASASAR